MEASCLGVGEARKSWRIFKPTAPLLLSPTKPNTKSLLIKMASHGPALQRREWHSLQTLELGSVSCIITSFQTGTQFCLMSHHSLGEAGVLGVQGCSVTGTPLGELRLLGWDLQYLH